MQTSSTLPVIYQIESLKSDGDCDVAKLTPATRRGETQFDGRICGENSRRMLEIAQRKGKLVSLDWRGGSAEPRILPVTIGMSVKASGEDEGFSLYFVPPRPALVRVRQSDAELTQLLQTIERDGDGVIIALEDGTIATDALPISQDAAKRLLGFQQ